MHLCHSCIHNLPLMSTTSRRTQRCDACRDKIPVAHGGHFLVAKLTHMCPDCNKMLCDKCRVVITNAAHCHATCLAMQAALFAGGPKLARHNGTELHDGD
jgi:hypothetical protein